MHLTYPVRVPTVSDGEHTHPSLGIVYMCPTYKRHSFWPFHSGSLRIIGLVIYIKARIGSLKTIHHIVLFWQTSLFSVLSGWVCNTNLKLCEEKVRVRKVSRKWECSFFESFKLIFLGIFYWFFLSEFLRHKFEALWGESESVRVLWGESESAASSKVWNEFVGSWIGLRLHSRHCSPFQQFEENFSYILSASNLRCEMKDFPTTLQRGGSLPDSIAVPLFTNQKLRRGPCQVTPWVSPRLPNPQFRRWSAETWLAHN